MKANLIFLGAAWAHLAVIVSGAALIGRLPPHGRPLVFTQVLDDCNAPWRYLGEQDSAGLTSRTWLGFVSPQVWAYGLTLGPDATRLMHVSDRDGHVSVTIQAGRAALFVCTDPPMHCRTDRFDGSCS